MSLPFRGPLLTLQEFLHRLRDHNNATTSVHGIADTADLVTTDDTRFDRRSLISGFVRGNLAASATNVQIGRQIGGSTIVLSVTMVSAGKLTGISVDSSAAALTGTATFRIFKNGVDTGISTTLSAANPNNNFATGDVDYAAGDKVDVRFSTTADWTPTTGSNLEAKIETAA